jgi:hypothetical protein
MKVDVQCTVFLSTGLSPHVYTGSQPPFSHFMTCSGGKGSAFKKKKGAYLRGSA